VLVLWLAIISANFSLFAPLNPTLIAPLVVFALSASAALPDPGDEPTVYGLDADTERLAAQCARAAWTLSHIWFLFGTKHPIRNVRQMSAGATPDNICSA